MHRDDFGGRTVVVMGLGRFGGGLDAAIFATKSRAKVIVTDMAGPEELAGSVEKLKAACGDADVQLHLAGHDIGDFEAADFVIANPAVPADNKYLRAASGAGATVTSQVEIFFELCPARIAGITGANGKSTTTALTAHILKNSAERPEAAYRKAWVGGNIGNEPLLTIVDQIDAADAVVLELSSFQVEQLARSSMAPHISLLTNLTPNHLDRYGTFEAYCVSKQHMFELQKTGGMPQPAISLFNADDEVGRQWFDRYSGQEGRLCRLFSADDVSDSLRKAYRLPGRINLMNLAAAMAIVEQFELSESAVADCLADFRGLSHRLEFVEQVDGVRWYNDSKSTTPLSAVVGLEAFDEPTILIAGGYDKHLPFDRLGTVIASRAKAVVLIGQTASKILDAVAASGDSAVQLLRAESLGDAVAQARDLARPGDVVLLSPACASYDMFENFEQRGAEFCRLVRQFADSQNA